MRKVLLGSIATLLAVSMAVPAFADDEENESSSSSVSSASSSSESSSSESSASSSSSSSQSSSSSAPRGREKALSVGRGKKIGLKRITSSDNEGKKQGKTLDAACMTAAVTAREDALITATQDRKPALIAAWSMTEKSDRNSAIKTAWTSFRKAKLAAWKTFKAAAKACGQNPSEESMGERL